jgi:predicted nucleotidyltransferase
LGRDFATMTESQQKQWKSSFDQSYDVAHQQGVKAERGFLSQNNAIEQDLSQTGSAKGVGSASIDRVGTLEFPMNRIGPNECWTDKSVFNTYPEKTTLTTTGIAEQSSFLSKHVPGLTAKQATLILDQGLKRNSTVVFGGSRIRGDFGKSSDIDVGFGNLSEKQAQRIIKNINKVADADPDFLKMEVLTIVPGKSTKTIDTITTPEQFFQRSGTRAGGDLKAGQPYISSGSITITPDGKIIILPPGS